MATPTPEEGIGDDNNDEAKEKEKKTRRSSKDVQRRNAVAASAKRRNSIAMKTATTLIKRSRELPKNHPQKKSIEVIVRETNSRYKATINEKTAGRYVRKGLVGQSPLKRGPIGHFSKPVYSALKGAYSTFLKLEQAESKKQSSIKQMSKLVNAAVNAGGFDKK